MPPISFVLPLLVAFLVSFFVTPRIAKKMYEKNIVGVDLHKIDKRKVSGAGGLAIFAGLISGLAITGVLGLQGDVMLSMLLSASLGFLIGLVDDILTLSKRTLILLTLAMGLPIITFSVGSTIVFFTPVGALDLGLVFWLMVPFIFAFLCNSVNIYAGFNGLETGLGLVTSIALATSAFFYNSMESFVTLIALSGALLGFLKWNKYPSKIFPGNSGTYLIGAVFAASTIAGTMKVAGLIACFPYFLNFLLRAQDRFRWTVGETDKTGLVHSDRRCSLWSLFMYKNPKKETTVVWRCIFIQMLFGVIAVVYSFLMGGIVA